MSLSLLLLYAVTLCINKYPGAGNFESASGKEILAFSAGLPVYFQGASMSLRVLVFQSVGRWALAQILGI